MREDQEPCCFRALGAKRLFHSAAESTAEYRKGRFAPGVGCEQGLKPSSASNGLEVRVTKLPSTTTERLLNSDLPLILTNIDPSSSTNSQDSVGVSEGEDEDAAGWRRPV